MLAEKLDYFSRVIQDYAEITCRPGFNPDGHISPETFDKLIGQYKLDHSVKCRHLRDSKVCLQDHNRGWLARAINGDEVLLGHNCAETHFDAESFKLQKSAINKEIERNTEIDKLQNYLADQEFLVAEADSYLDRAVEIRRQHDLMVETLPASVKDILSTMSRERRSVVEIETQSDFDNSWNTRRIAEIQGMGFWRLRLKEPIDGIESTRNAIRSARISPEIKTRQLRAWNKAIREFGAHKESIESAEASYTKFKSEENLSLLLLLIGNQTEQEQIVSLISIVHGLNLRARSEKREYVTQLDKELRQSLDTKNFRRIRNFKT